MIDRIIRALRWLPTVLAIPMSAYAWRVAGPPTPLNAFVIVFACALPFLVSRIVSDA